MHERRIIVELPQENSAPQFIPLSPENQKHLLTVLRLELGATVLAVDKRSGLAYQTRLEKQLGNWILEVLDAAKNQTPLSFITSLCFALCKGDTNELVLQKAVELGVQNIVLWKADRSIAQFSNAEHKSQRWHRIIEEATKQCGLSALPRLHLKRDFSEVSLFLRALSPSTVFCCSLGSEARPVTQHQLNGPHTHILVGPEGDFSPEEYAGIQELGALSLSLGPTRLRSETAAICAIAMVQARWGYTSTGQLPA